GLSSLGVRHFSDDSGPGGDYVSSPGERLVARAWIDYDKR
ncbi:MAG: hypothetical protein ACI82F_002737, partial [Planctomycetota bacterium]